MEPPPLPPYKPSQGRIVTIGFWVLWGINAVIAAIVLFFFFWGVEDGSVSSFNILIWLAMLAAVTGTVGGSLWLRANGKAVIAIGILLVLAIPGLLFGLFFLVLIIAQPNWH